MAALIGIRKQFDGQRVVDDFSLNLDSHRITALVGSSGCGKSTVLRIAAGLLPCDEGRVEVRPDEVGVVFQDARLLPWLTVRENLGLALPFREPRRHELIARVLAIVHLDGHENKLPRQLSGGMAQRVSIARALLRRPRLLLMDEPFAALDAITRAELQRMLVKLVHEEGLNCLFVTHDLQEAELISDRLIVMREGRIARSYEKIDSRYPAILHAEVHQLLNLR